MLWSLRDFLMISLFFFGSIRPLLNEFSKSRYLEFSPSVITLSWSRAFSKIALSRTFCPVPSEFEIAGLDCIVIQKLLIMLGLRVGIINLNKAKHKKDWRRINTSNMAYKKTVGLVLFRKWEKRNRISFYWESWQVLKVIEMLLVRVGSIPLGEYWDILGQKIMPRNLV